MITTLQDFVNEFNKIQDAGWIRTHRSGPTGIGKTLEDLLGIAENNFDAPDFGDYELKSCRIDSHSMLTMFTRTPQPAGINTYLREKYGYSSNAYDNSEKVLHTTLSADRFTSIADTGKSLKISCRDDRICIISQDYAEEAYWDKMALKRCFEKKYKNKFVYVKALSRGVRATEEFKYIEAYEISEFDYESFLELLSEGKIYVDIRIGQYHEGEKKGMTHDHGTGFRIREIDQPLLFKNVNRIA